MGVTIKTLLAGMALVLAICVVSRAGEPFFNPSPSALEFSVCESESACRKASRRFLLSVRQGDRLIRIESLPDGKVQVSRTNTKLGASKVKVYKDLRQLRRDDPDAYDLLERSGVLAAPDLGNWPHRREQAWRDWREAWRDWLRPWEDYPREKLKDAERELQELRRRITQYEKDLRKWVERRSKHLPRPPQLQPRFELRPRSAPSNEQPDLRAVTVDEDGGITIEMVDQSGREVVLRFESERALKRAAPRLYQRYKQLLGDVAK